MKVDVKPGKYVIAVSGGVDSMVLLDVLCHMPHVDLVVAHFDHGIRKDSAEDRHLVERTAKRYGLPFEAEQGHLGPAASEATARTVRYAFLRRVKAAHQAQGIITAHHQDDMLETAIINMLRGTGRKGLSALASTTDLARPLLHVAKKDIRAYADKHHLAWREDTTNASDQYLRNYLRHRLLATVDERTKERLLTHVHRAAELNEAIDRLLLSNMGGQMQAELSRSWFIMLPYDVSCEVMAAWLRAHGFADFDRRLIARLVVTSKVARPGKLTDVNAGHWLKVNKTTLQLTPRRLS